MDIWDYDRRASRTKRSRPEFGADYRARANDGDQAGAQGLSAQVNQKAGIEQPQNQDPLALAPMPPAPKAAATEVDNAKATRNQSAAQAALNKIYKETPPGSAGYIVHE
jgi:hypothetical protein